jgi:hypothetical protein
MTTNRRPFDNTAAGSQDAVDRWVTRVLRDQPPLKAPATLDGRVFAAIANTGAVPWWQQPLQGWPMAARCMFVAVSIACIWLGLSLTGFAAGLVGGSEGAARSTAAIPGFGLARALFDTLSILTVVVRTLADSLPQLWLYGGLLVIAGIYGSFFGLGAVGYRAFHRLR